jgi:dTDP-4-amino-4,6-dideoxy-D-galactose acyltransferase
MDVFASRPLQMEAVRAQGFEPLPWDSALFGFPVARVFTHAIDAGRVSAVVEALRFAGVRLAYVSVPWTHTHATDALAQAGARCVDRKVRLRKEAISGRATPPGVESVLGTPCTSNLERLALASGGCSRFRADPGIPSIVFERLYIAWIRRSVAGEIAQDVLVIRDGSLCAGMVTVNGSDGDATGTIGLLAVDEAHRGRGYGKRLVDAAEVWCAARGMMAVEVVTQMRNTAAYGLYTACGYGIVGDEAVFHIWPEVSR